MTNDKRIYVTQEMQWEQLAYCSPAHIHWYKASLMDKHNQWVREILPTVLWMGLQRQKQVGWSDYSINNNIKVKSQ
jgi:hypothetical protein